jgi:hypothetical protein
MAKRLAIILSVFMMVGCAATKTFNQYAKSGETVAIATGYQPDWSRDNISVWVEDPPGNWVQYPANDPRIRAVVNFYPDPISSLVVSNRTGQDITKYAELYGDNVNNFFTGGDRDWSQTVVFFDLPDPMTLGTASVYVEEVANTSNYVNTTLEIVETGGTPHSFGTDAGGPLQRVHLAALERASHYTVTLSGTGAIPHAVQLDFTHDPDADNGGVGKAYVVEPISGVKNISWTDDGTNLRVVVLPADGNTPISFEDFKFYVAGGITNLAPSVEPGSTLAFNINGGDVTGIAPPIVTAHDIVIDDGL